MRLRAEGKTYNDAIAIAIGSVEAARMGAPLTKERARQLVLKRKRVRRAQAHQIEALEAQLAEISRTDSVWFDLAHARSEWAMGNFSVVFRDLQRIQEAIGGAA